MTDNRMKGNILLVEPNPDLAKNLKVLLSTMEGFRVIGQCSSGLDAMRMMATLSVDVLFLDLSLSDIAAIDVAWWTRKLFPKMNMVLLSSYDLREYWLAARQLNNTVIISKRELCKKVPQALSRLRRKQLAREREMGGVLLAQLGRDLRSLAAWVEIAAMVRDQAPVWRFIHLLMAVLALLLLAAMELGTSGMPTVVVAG